MKKSIPQLRVVMLPLTVIIIIGLFCFQYNSTKNINNADDVEANESLQKKRNIEEAFKQEFNRTKDPATNTVPRERLMTAAEQAKQYFENLPNAAISGISWQEHGPANVGGRTRALVFDTRDATNNTLFAGGVAGGIWKCTSLSSTPVWMKMSDILDNIAISCILQDPTNSNTFYAGTGETWGNSDALRGLGIWKSTDGGVNWVQIPSTNNSAFYYVQKIIINSAGNIFAATSSGIKKSTNAGVSWANVLTGNIADMEIAANNDLYASNFFGRVYKSTSANAGGPGSWTDISPAGAFKNVEIATAPNDAQRVYILCEGPVSSDCDAIFRSENAGGSWTSCPIPTIIDQGSNSVFTRQQAWYDLIATVDPNNADVIIIGGVDGVRSTTKGASWQQITTWSLFSATGFTQIVHADHHAAVFAPGSSSRFVWGTDGGVYFSDNVNVVVTGSVKPTVVAKNDGYNITQFYCGAIHPAAGNNSFLAGAQDNGSQRFSGAGIVNTTEVSGGDGAFCHINQTNANYQVTSYVYSNFYRSTNAGSSFSQVVSDNNGSFINPTDLDGANNILFAGYTAGQYFRWPVAGNTTKAVTVTNFGTAIVTNVYVSPNTNDRVYFGLDDGSVVFVDGASTGNGPVTKTGTIIKTGIGSVSSIAIETGNENHILVTYSNYGVTSVFETTNGGTAWTNIEGNLPDMPVRWVVFNPLNNTQALLATEMGVWTTTQLNGTSTDWTPTNQGLANTRVDVLKVRSSDNTILAATHGRGLFTTTLSNTVLPFTYFASAKNTATESAPGTSCALGFTDIPVKLSISAAPATNVSIGINVAATSTATDGRDFTLSTNTVTFVAGSTASQTFNIRVYDDNDYEGTESVVLNYTITAGAASAQKGNTLQNFQLDIQDNETAPAGPSTAQIASGVFATNLGPSSPLQSTVSDKRCQYLYRASELLAAGLKAGNISSFNFSVSSKASTLAYNGFTIKLATTSLTDLSAGFASPTFTTVYTAPVGGFVPVMGENEFTLSSFTWDGTSNLIFQFCYNNSANGAANTDDIIVGEQAPGYICQQRVTSTTTSNDGCALTTPNANNSFRPLLIFSQPVAATGIATALSTTKQASVGPFETVHFYDGSGNIIATVQNMDNWNYGCTTIDIDRAGTSAIPFWSNTASDYVASRTIRIVPTTDNLSGNVAVTLYYTAAEKAGWETVTGQTWNTIGMVKVKNARINDVTPGNPMTTSVYFGTVINRGTIGTNYTVTASFNSGFSGFGVGKISGPVAITGLTFTGRVINSYASLSWTTLTETNSRDFEIERSDNGIFFHSIGSVTASGNSSSSKQYFYTDPAQINAIQYYRIKQYDILGNFSYSNIVHLQVSKIYNNVWPNPFTDNINVQFSENVNSTATATLSDISGRKIASVNKQVAGNNWNINFSKINLPAGNYMLQVSANGKTNNYKIAKE